ncbi:MAG: sodium:solute symporter family protein [Salibacteraceae bacterium]|mgnify:CR=1 FL=1
MPSEVNSLDLGAWFSTHSTELLVLERPDTDGAFLFLWLLMDTLNTLDWALVVGYLLLTLLIGLRFRAQAGKSISDFFLGGRNLPWHIAGISMVATTFAADTPIWVTEQIHRFGISGNWQWWNMLIGGMLTTFFFAKMWRRSGVLTELELIELRYSGKPATLLRGFKSIYMGIFLNAIIIGWVNAALLKILTEFFGLPAEQGIWIAAGLMVLVAFYSSLSGLMGVAITDIVQFVLAMTGCIVLAFLVVNSEEVGGIAGLKEKLPAWRFDFFPQVSGDSGGGSAAEVFSLSIGGFLAYGMFQWWASWYPGNEPGGGGYISQRMMSARSEKDALLSTLLFNIAHYCLRPWPWIVVGLCALVLYPDLGPQEAGNGYIRAMVDHLPHGLLGLLFVAFLAAYMSTISTHLNWGASYLTNDFYKRFLKPESSFPSAEAAQKNYVWAARVSTLLIMVISFGVTLQIETVDQAARFLIECGAGLGLVLILRWYWWRINAWSEITATLAPLVGYTLGNFVFDMTWPNSFFFTIVFSTVCWLIATFITPPTDDATLEEFYRRVRPAGSWKKIRQVTGLDAADGNTSWLILAWLSGIFLTYSVLFALGKTIFAMWMEAGIWSGCSVISMVLLRWSLKRSGILREMPENRA